MKKSLLSIFCLFLLLSSCFHKHQSAPDLLWKITTQDSKQAYLFGTLHVYPEDQVSISDEVLAALKTCRVLAMERNVRDVEDQELFIEHNKHPLVLKTYQVLLSKYGSSLKNMEGELMQVADRHQIRITGLETATEVLEILERVPITPENLTEEQILTQTERLIEVYSSGQVDYVATQMLVRELGAETKKLLVDQRNLNWLDDIENLIHSEPVFIAVGMGHLGGENGLIHLLRQKGYTVERARI